MNQIRNRAPRKARLCLGCSMLLSAGAATAQAQWTVTNLHPEGAGQSHAYCVFGGRQAGTASLRACVWSGSAQSRVDLNPAEAYQSFVVGIDDTQQTGFYYGYGLHACLWSGSAESWVDLNPEGSAQSQANGVSNGQQVGYCILYADGQVHASLWTGSAASWVDLNPAGATYSYALGVWRGQQAGISRIGGGAIHAGLWTGSAASWVDLNPPGASESQALAVANGQQAGYANIGGVSHAGQWSSSAASWVDLHPVGATSSSAQAIFGGQAAGVASIAGADHASVWSGTAASWVDLHAFLPAEFSSSVARGIWSDAGVTYVAGYGHNTATGRDEALLWTYSAPPPCPADFNQDGGIDGSDVGAFFAAWETGSCN